MKICYASLMQNATERVSKEAQGEEQGGSPMLSIDNLTKRYGKNVAVDGISLAVPRGQFFGFLGPNGAGKSSTIHCIIGVARITSGTITVGGVDVVEDYKEARKKIGVSPQEFNTDFFGKADDILDYMGGFYGMPKAVRKERVDELLEQFHLKDHRKKKFNELSGGLKRRVILARALVHKPELLILDEPTSGVDVEQRHELWQYFRELSKTGMTIILTSHYLEEVELLCDRVAIINKGKIISDRPKEEFVRNGQTLEQRYLEITREDNAKVT
jgi:ABC-2 type transport system ATP-binding protein